MTDWRALDALRNEIADKGIDSVTAEPRPGGGWRHTRIEAHDDHDVRLIVEYVPPDRSGEWVRVGQTFSEVTWRNQLTGRHAKTPIVRTRQTRTVGDWVNDGQQGLEL